MKVLRISIFIVSIVGLVFLFGCPARKTVTTKINRDGSCTRVVGTFDSRDFKGIDSVKQNLPIPIDQSWELQAVDDTTAVLSKDFDSVSELNASYVNDASEMNMYKRKVELEKKFRWFHTVFQFKETYGGVFTEIPLTNYLSDAEIETLKMDNADNHPLLAGLEKKSQKITFR